MWLWIAGFACTGAPTAPEPAPAPTEATADALDAPPAGSIGGEPILPRPVVIGALSSDAVSSTVEASAAAVRACYERGGEGHDGKVLLRFLVLQDGHVGRVATQSTSLRAPAAEACLNELVGALQFPPLTSGETAIVHYPFVFP